jgi:hypothetical protein
MDETEDAAVALRAVLLDIRLTARWEGDGEAPLRAALDSAARSVRRLRHGADEVQLGYLALVEASLDRSRDAATQGEWPIVERLADAVHNVPYLWLAPAGWSHRFFRDCFLDALVGNLLPMASAPLRALLDVVAPSAHLLADEIARAHRSHDEWAQTRARIEAVDEELDLDAEEVALRVLKALGWPEVVGEDYAEVAAIAAQGDEALWRLVNAEGVPRSASR